MAREKDNGLHSKDLVQVVYKDNRKLIWVVIILVLIVLIQSGTISFLKTPTTIVKRLYSDITKNETLVISKGESETLSKRDLQAILTGVIDHYDLKSDNVLANYKFLMNNSIGTFKEQLKSNQDSYLSISGESKIDLVINEISEFGETKVNNKTKMIVTSVKYKRTTIFKNGKVTKENRSARLAFNVVKYQDYAAKKDSIGWSYGLMLYQSGDKLDEI